VLETFAQTFVNHVLRLTLTVKTVTHIVELLYFAQDRIRIHGVRGFPENLRGEQRFRWADLVQET
jgi:hypothetical protein